MNMLGYEVGELRMPLCEMEEKNALRVKTSLQKLGLL